MDVCIRCGKSGVLRCGKCRIARYCSIYCQVGDVENHQKDCDAKRGFDIPTVLSRCEKYITWSLVRLLASYALIYPPSAFEMTLLTREESKSLLGEIGTFYRLTPIRASPPTKGFILYFGEVAVSFVNGDAGDAATRAAFVPGTFGVWDPSTTRFDVFGEKGRLLSTMRLDMVVETNEEDVEAKMWAVARVKSLPEARRPAISSLQSVPLSL